MTIFYGEMKPTGREMSQNKAVIFLWCQTWPGIIAEPGNARIQYF